MTGVNTENSLLSTTIVITPDMNNIPPKRALGRGLEALLTDMPAKPVTDKQSIDANPALVRAIRQENSHLLQEAEALKMLLEELENVLGDFNSDSPIY
ncbi:hypothetical protein [Methylomonas albis]|uniref:Uncharacterized protein n=1 Tax=Methylomonas albis TaxID=1854563 RepID=A0ABR9D568_9GAMM|nr:hypothetical protein [Methylomonas albis]MBD9358280.1 hypothetical protein [Methylomonas albis]